MVGSPVATPNNSRVQSPVGPVQGMRVNQGITGTGTIEGQSGEVGVARSMAEFSGGVNEGEGIKRVEVMQWLEGIGQTLLAQWVRLLGLMEMGERV